MFKFSSTQSTHHLILGATNRERVELVVAEHEGIRLVHAQAVCVAAIVLALITKEVYSSLFAGIVCGALLYANGNLELMLNTMLFNEDGGMVYKLADSWNVGILVFLVILGIILLKLGFTGIFELICIFCPKGAC
mgnify:CR=1 FL=1